jgi:hypothetical protein
VTIRRSLLVGMLLTVAIGAILMASPLRSVTSDAFDKVSVTRSTKEGKTSAAGSELNVSGASAEDIDRSLVGVVTLGAVFLGLALLMFVIIAVSLRF